MLAFGLVCLSLFAWGQTKNRDQPTVSTTEIHGSAPGGDAYIVKCYVDEALPGSGYETGSLHLVYSDKTEVVETLPAKKKSTEDNIVFHEEGIFDPKVAPDKRTVAWTENFDNCCTSYSVPVVLDIYTSGKRVVHSLPDRDRRCVWYWAFRSGGERVTAVWGPTHGPEVGDYQLYDVKTGRMVAQVYGDLETQSLQAYTRRSGQNRPKSYFIADDPAQQETSCARLIRPGCCPRLFLAPPPAAGGFYSYSLSRTQANAGLTGNRFLSPVSSNQNGAARSAVASSG